MLSYCKLVKHFTEPFFMANSPEFTKAAEEVSIS